MSPNFGLSITPSSKVRSRPSSRNSGPSQELRTTFSSGRSSTLESPGRSGSTRSDSTKSSTFHMIQSPTGMGIGSMTPLSNIHSGFPSTPYDGDSLQLFSPSNICGDELNRNLFSAGDKSDHINDFSDFALKTPNASDRPKMCFSKLRIGVDTIHSSRKKTPISDVKFREVAISPISQFPSGVKRRSTRKFFQEEKKEDCNSNFDTPAVVSLGSCPRMTHPLTVSSRRSALKEDRKSCSALKQRSLMPKMTESRDDNTHLRKCSMEEVLNAESDDHSKIDTDDLTIPNNVTNDDSEGNNREAATASPFLNSKIMEGLPTPTAGADADEKFWADTGGGDISFSPTPGHALTPLKSPKNKISRKREFVSPVPNGDAFINSFFMGDGTSTPRSTSKFSPSPSSPKRRRMIKEEIIEEGTVS